MKQVEIRLDGIEHALARLKNMQECDATVERGLKKGGQRIAEAAKLLCPVATDRGGTLRDSIKVQKREPLTAYIFSSEDYAAPVEYGTGSKGDPKVEHTDKTVWFYYGRDGKLHACHGTSPQPFFQPAFEQNKSFVPACVQQELRRAAGIGGGTNG